MSSAAALPLKSLGDMQRVTAASAPTTIQRNVRLVGYPDACPRCQRTVVPRHIGTYARSHILTADVEEVFQCTASACGGVFIAVFKASEIGRREPRYTYVRSIPTEPAPAQVSATTMHVAPRFAPALTQALGAEAAGLTEVAGFALRRALEFLVRDFAKHESPDDAAKIDDMTLAECIVAYVGDP